MSLYLDTSVVVSLITGEASAERVRQWLGARSEQELSISPWVTTEVSSALSLKIRTGQLTDADRNSALRAYRTMAADSLVMLEVPAAAFPNAARLADHQALGLRAGDALHLAIALEHGAELVTLDRKLFEAGPALGGIVHLI